LTGGIQRQPEPEVMNDPTEARAYAAADFTQVNQVFVERLLELVGPRPAATALDLGTGPADIPLRVVAVRPRWRVVAVDASRPMLEWAHQAVQKAGRLAAVGLVMADAKDLPFAPRSFDVIFSNSILHHITATERLWREIERLGRPGATVLIRDLARPANPQAARSIVHRYAGGESPLLQEEYYRSLLSAYTPREVRAQLDAAGFRTLQVAMVSDRHLDVFGHLE